MEIILVQILKRQTKPALQLFAPLKTESARGIEKLIRIHGPKPDYIF